jgi:hypothetical protein
MRNMCRHAGRQIYENEKTRSTHTQVSKSIKYIYVEICSKIQDTQHIGDTTAGPDRCQAIWAYHLPPCKFNTGPTTGP